MRDHKFSPASEILKIHFKLIPWLFQGKLYRYKMHSKQLKTQQGRSFLLINKPSQMLKHSEVRKYNHFESLEFIG